MQFWLPQIVKAFGLTNAQTGFVTAIPYLFGTIAMILWARHSDATRERVAHVGSPLLLTAVGAGGLSSSPIPSRRWCALTVAAIGVFCTFAVFWTLPTAWLSGTAAAGGDRADQFDRQSRRLRRAVSGRLGQGSDRQHVDRPAGAVGVAAAAGLLVFLGGHETKTEFAGSEVKR